MPAGVPWPKYLKFFAAAMVTMMAGAQTVHIYYKPLEDLNTLVEKEIERRRQDVTAKNLN
jgi:hypothetical protein